jgi:hypothetical protein
MPTRGRPRDPDAKRRRRTTRAARAATEAGPTPELLAQRRRLSGDAAVPIDFPLDVLAARHRRDPAAGLGPEECRAGWRFAHLAWRVFRAPVPLPPLFWATRIEAGRGPDPLSEADRAEEEARRMALYRAARAALAAAGPAAVRAVDHAVVAMTLPADAAALAALRRGLARLHRHFSEARRR